MEWQHQFEIIKKIAANKIENMGGKFSLAQLDRILGVTPGKSRHWEKGQRPSADDLEIMARRLDLSPRWLLMREGSPTGVDSSQATIGETTAQQLEAIETFMLRYGASPEELREAFRLALGRPAQEKNAETNDNFKQLKVGNSR